MVAISLVRQSNETLRNLPPHLSSPTAVFTGATQGIGLATLRQLAIHTVNPTCYIVGRNEARLQEIVDELKELNAKGTYVSVKGEVSLLESVDECCGMIKQMIGEGRGVDLLCMSQGYLTFGGRDGKLRFTAVAETVGSISGRSRLTVPECVETKEGLDRLLSLRYYSRLRTVYNLLPLLSLTPNPHIVSVLAADNEGKIYEDDLELKHNYGFISCMYHGNTMTSLAFEHLAKENPKVAFVHVYPGYVRTNIMQSGFSWPLISFLEIPVHDVGDRQVFHATSSRYPSLSASKTTASPDSTSLGAPLPEGVDIADGSDGKRGSGAYLTMADSEAAPSGTGKLMTGYRERGLPEKVWKHTLETFSTVSGTLR
ncbi:MAG: hypothetical protein LQ338_005918 [Usnochroma carphineum]|nr:MAG: hypothetical protein LQ338_005918 [Usnochroma carphineum]